jgi:hypothetical protein
MSSTLDESIRAALAAIVAESPDLGSLAVDDYVPRRPAAPRRHPRRITVVVVICVVAALCTVALVLQRPSRDELEPARPPATTDKSATADVTRRPSFGFLSVPTMDGGAFVIDGPEWRMGLAMHDPATPRPQDATNAASVIFVQREQFGPLEDLAVGAEIDWKPIGATVEMVFTVIGVHSYNANVDPSTTDANGLVLVLDTAGSDTGRRIVITAQRAADTGS